MRALDFLPQHFLLTSVGESGQLTWQDTSTGRIVAQAKTKLGPCSVLTHDPHTGVSGLGHGRGIVTLWTPNQPAPVAKILAHYGPVVAAAYAPGSARHTCVTAGMDRRVKVWDMRMMRPLHEYETPAPVTALGVSQRGLLAVGWGRRLQIWQDALLSKAKTPYMTHLLPAGGLSSLVFAPYDDVLVAGHEGGISTVLIPGSGEANYDSRVADPFQANKARRESEVHRLLDKLQPEMIVLDPDSIGGVQRTPLEVQKEKAVQAAAANQDLLDKQRGKTDARTPMKGKNKPSRRQKRKQLNVIEDKKPGVKERMREQGVLGGTQRKEREPIPDSVPRALHRFFRR